MGSSTCHRKAIFALYSSSGQIPLKIGEKLKSFDSLILPILMYGVNVWGFHKADDVEKVHLKFLEQILGLQKQTPLAAVYGEVVRYPLLVLHKKASIKYLEKIKTCPNTLYIRFLT